jgi:tetratricopeptide (TPR) repeat protein
LLIECRLFKRCFWVDATDIYTAQEGYEEIANEAFPEKENGSTSMKEVQNWMSTLEEEWLLVLDNSNADDIREFVPPGKTGNIIYTSRRHNLAVSLRPEWVAEVNEIESDDAITLLLLTAGLVAYHPDRRAEAAPVVQELGYLPLAIDQAGAYIRRMGRPLGAYLALFRNQRQQLIRDPDFKCMLRDPAVKGTDPRNQAVYATFDISYNALRDIMHEHDGTRKGEDARNALNLLRLICFYHNDSVMVDMFYRAAAWRRPSSKRPVHPLGYGKDSLNNLVTVIDNEWDKDPVMFGLMVLEDFSLAKWDEGRENISMHILVYDWARARIGTADMTRRAGYARAILFDSIPYDKQLASFRFRRRIYPHMEACMRRTEIWAENDCVRAEYMMKLGTLYEQKGQYQDARNVLQEAICLLEVERGRGDHHTLRAMERLASVEHDDFKLGAAEFLFLQCVERCDIQIKEINARQEARKVERPNPNELEWSPEYVEYVKQRRQAEVMEDESLFKRSSALKAEMLKKLAGVYILQAMWTSAEEALHKSIALYDEFAPGSAASANARRSLSGIIAHRDGSSCQGPSRTPQDARASLLEAIRVYGHDDMRTMNAMEALVKAEIETGNAGAAEEVAYFFFARCAEEYGQDSKQLLNALSLFCSVLDQKKQAIATEEYRRNILAASQRTLGLYHPKTIDRLLFLGAAITQSGRFDEGEMVFAKGLEVMEAVFGSTHESVREHREVLETMKNNKARASTATLRGLAREALRQNHMYLGKTLVEDEAFEDWVDFWVRYNHITKYWNKGFPEQAYFAEPPPLVNSQFVAEEEEQQANRQLELPLQHGFS